MLHSDLSAALTRVAATKPSRPVVAPGERLLLSAVEAAALLGMSVRLFHQTRPRLPQPVTLGKRHVRWRRADLISWVASLEPSDAAHAEPPQLARGKAAKKAV